VSGNRYAGWVSRGRTANQWATAVQGCGPSRSPAQRAGENNKIRASSALPKVAEEVLALTKVNWNTTQFDQKLPAPIKAAREVGRILKHIEYGVPTSPDFRKYT